MASKVISEYLWDGIYFKEPLTGNTLVTTKLLRTCSYRSSASPDYLEDDIRPRGGHKKRHQFPLYQVKFGQKSGFEKRSVEFSTAFEISTCPGIYESFEEHWKGYQPNCPPNLVILHLVPLLKVWAEASGPFLEYFTFSSYLFKWTTSIQYNYDTERLSLTIGQPWIV